MSPTPEDKFISFWSFTFLVIGNIIVVCATLLLWKYFWLGSNNLSIPSNDQFPKSETTSDNQVPLYSIFQTLRLIKKVITNTEPEYIINKLGHEGYFYLLFIKRLVQIELTLCLLDVTVSLPYVLFFKEVHVEMLIRIESEGNAVFRTIHTTVTSFIVVYSLYSLRILFSKTLRYQVVKDKDDDELVLEWLKLRTLYLQILFKQTTTETIQQIRNYLQRFLNVDCETRYEIYDIIPVSDYQNLLKKLSDYWSYKTIVSETEKDDLPTLYKYLSCTNRDRIDAKLLELQEQIETENEQTPPVVGFFLVLDSVDAIQILQNHFNLTSRIQFCRDFELIEEIDYPFIINKICSPDDLIWENLQYSRSSIIREFLFNMLSVFVLVFISTPAAVLNWIKVPAIITPYFVIIVNSVLFYILSMFVMQQKHFRQSKKEKIECKMLLFYMGMNMIVGSIARNIKNVTDLLQQGGWMWIEVFELVFKKIDGLYYCVLFFNQLTISLVYSLLKPLQILTSYGWINLYIAKSKLSQRIFYSQNYNFPYAYNYCLIITLFIISIIYSLSIPGIHFFGLLFFVGKQYSDTYTLLTFHKKQFESVGDLIVTIIFYTSLASAVHLFLVANSLLVERQYFNAIFLYGALGVVIYVCYQLKQSITKELDLIADVPKDTTNINQRDLYNWKKCYEHPLMSENNLNVVY